MESQQIAVVTVPLNEWNEQKALLKEVAEQVKSISKKGQKDLLTTKEACEVLKIGRTTFERYVNNGIIPVIKINKRKYSKNFVKRADLDELIRNGSV